MIDGNSSDGSKDLIANEKQYITTSISEDDTGIYDAMNKGINLASGDYIYFLNSGDVFFDLKALLNISQNYFTEDIIYGNTILNNSSHQKLIPPSVLDVSFFMTGTLWHPCVFTKKEAFLKFGLFNTDLRITGDFEFLIRAIIKNGASCKYIDNTISLFDMSGISNNPKNISLEIEERIKSWKLNFSDFEINVFEEHTKILRSGEYKWGRILKKILKPFGAK